eukprot:scaffold83578_cov20-Tisochrysis_lutea.AAC.1
MHFLRIPCDAAKKAIPSMNASFAFASNRPLPSHAFTIRTDTHTHTMHATHMHHVAHTHLWSSTMPAPEEFTCWPRFQTAAQMWLYRESILRLPSAEISNSISGISTLQAFRVSKAQEAHFAGRQIQLHVHTQEHTGADTYKASEHRRGSTGSQLCPCYQQKSQTPHLFNLHPAGIVCRQRC